MADRDREALRASGDPKWVPTIAQLRVLVAIRTHQVRTGMAPTYDELREALDVASNNTVRGHLDGLRKRGLLREREPKKARSLVLTRAGMRVLRAPAGEEEIAVAGLRQRCFPRTARAAVFGDLPGLPGGRHGEAGAARRPGSGGKRDGGGAGTLPRDPRRGRGQSVAGPRTGFASYLAALRPPPFRRFRGAGWEG